MGNLFGVKRRAPQITAQDRAVLQLKQQRDKIKIYQKKTETDLEKNKELALKLFSNGMKERALIVLRRKKYMEDVLTRTDKQLETLESLVTDIEYTQIEVSVVEGLRVGGEALKQLNSLMNVEDIQQLMEDNAEAAEKQKEISAILQQTTERYDNSDLLEELERYKQQAEPAVEPKQEVTEPDTTPDQVSAETTSHTAPEERQGEIIDKLEELPDVPEEQPSETTPTKRKNQEATESKEERLLELA